MPDPVLFGAAYSVYVRIVRLALAEKRVPYRLHEVDVFVEFERVVGRGGIDRRWRGRVVVKSGLAGK